MNQCYLVKVKRVIGYWLRQFAQLNNNVESGIIIFIQDMLSLGEARNGA